MKDLRRWGVALAALLMAVSLVCAPREGSARSVEPRILPGDPRPTQEMGEPDIPPNTGPLTSYRVWLPSVLLARGIRVDVAMVLGVPRCPAGTRLARCTLRPVARP